MTKFHHVKDKWGRKVKGLIPLVALILLLVLVLGSTEASADTGGQVSVVVNYLTETATISPGPGGSNAFYISFDKGKTWEGINAGDIDIASFLSTKEVELYFKGNKDTVPKIVPLMAEPPAPKVTYTVSGGIGHIIYSTTTGGTVEYRNGANGTWKTAVNNMATSIYEIKGTTLYYRTAATSYSRPSKIASVKVPKRPTAPAVKLDGSKLMLTGFKPGETEYRINDEAGWTTFPVTDMKAKSISLYTLFTYGVVSSSTPLPAGKIEFRTKGSDKKVASASKIIEIPAQFICPEVIYNSGSTITISDSTPKRSYEYTRVAAGSTLDFSTAKWTTIPTNKPTIITKVNVNDKVYVRIKSYTDSVTKQIVPASTCKEIVIYSITPGKTK